MQPGREAGGRKGLCTEASKAGMPCIQDDAAEGEGLAAHCRREGSGGKKKKTSGSEVPRAAAGLFAVAFGPAYCQLLLRLAYGERWAATGAPAALAAYCPYILLLAVNGILEAFVHAVAAPAELAAANAALVGCAGAHMAAVAAASARGGGAPGVVAADALSMAARIAYSAWFVRRRFAGVPGFGLAALLPRGGTLCALAAAAAATLASAAACGARLGFSLAPGSGPAAALARRAAAAAAAVLPAGEWARAGVHVGLGAGVLAAAVGAVLRAEAGLLAELRALGRKDS